MKELNLLLLAAVTLGLAVSRGAAAPVISSPEGTATKYVSEKGPLVYAPRAARAQKVVFDTPEKQLIHAPDTPFRKFFESHSSDFDPDKLEYAKTTMLNDIVNMLRSREFIREQVTAVVEAHKLTAISAQSPLRQALEHEAGIIAADGANYAADLKTRGAREITAPPGLDKSLAKLATLAEPHSSVPEFRRLLQSVQAAQDALKQAKTNPVAAVDGLQKAVVNIEVAQKAATASAPVKLEEEHWRENRTRLLIDTLYLELLQANYPDMEDDEIAGLMTRFTGEMTEFEVPRGGLHPIWKYATAPAPDDNLPARRALALELTQRLILREWLRRVVDRSSARRLDLFKQGGSPLEGLLDAQTAIQKFVKANLGSATLQAGLKDGSGSLWAAFLNDLNTDESGSNQTAVLGAPLSRSRSLDLVELADFGRELREHLRAAAKSSGGTLEMPPMKEALTEFLIQPDKARFLRPQFGLNLTIDKLEAQRRAEWTNDATDDLDVKDSFRKLTNHLSSYANSACGPSCDAKGGPLLSNFLAEVQQSLRGANSARPTDDRVDTAEMEGSVAKAITQRLNEVWGHTDMAAKLDLAELLQAGFEVNLPLSTARARKRLVANFETVFTGCLGLIGSDEPMLRAFLNSSAVSYGLPEYRRQATSIIPPRFAKLAAELTGGAASDPMVLLKQITDQPDVAFLFGPGPANAQVMEAFKAEFCDAFQDREILSAALAAEREADYEYWWLTFYPKAIPLGNKRLEGASIIEIAFPEAVVPEDQYHRWLQDTKLTGDLVGAAGERSRPRSRRDQDGAPSRGLERRSEGAQGEITADIRLRNASSMLRDMLDVLNAPELKSRFDEVRPAMHHVLDQFVSSAPTIDQRYRNGVRAMFEEVFPEDRRWVRELAAIIDKHGFAGDRPGHVLVKESGTPVDLDLSALLAPTNGLSAWRTNLLCQLSLDRGSWLLATSQITSPANLLAALTSHDPVSEFLWKKFRSAKQNNLTNPNPTPHAAPVPVALCDELNRILKGPSIYDSQRFQGKPLRLETRHAIGQKPDGKDLVRLNRLLLEDAFPNAIEKAKPCAGTPDHAIAALPALAGLVQALEERNKSDPGVQDPEGRLGKAVRDRVRAYAVAFYLTQKSDPQVRSDLRLLLGWVPFRLEHVLFSVYAVTETRDRLPEKVNLYTYAVTEGARRYARKEALTTGETNSLEGAWKAWGAGSWERDRDSLRGKRLGQHGCTRTSCTECAEDSMARQSKEAVEALRSIVVNAYFSSYPAVPSQESIKESFFEQGGRRLGPLIFNWLDYYGVFCPEGSSRIHRSALVREMGFFLTLKAQRLLLDCLETSMSAGEAVTNILGNIACSPLLKELYENLFDDFYGPYWDSLARIEQAERHPIPFQQIRHDDFVTFRSWSHPVFQRGIQIVDMLPASRDDLVSMSINEGGVVARIAGKADADVAYDLNEAKMALRMAQSAATKFDKVLKSRQETITNALGALQETQGESRSSTKNQVFEDLARMGRSANSQGYSVSASASASVYGRAKAALAYSRRREYLDAAITSAGRGDSFAKWVVRKSDLRSDLAKGGGKKLVAAAHNGFPNGDQPFHLLVKVPRKVMNQDWQGRRYVHFNSTYVATSRDSCWKNAGFLGLVGKVPLTVLNPHWWSEIEEGLVGTQYPFMWDVGNERDQQGLLRTPNILGGAVWLDDTDKIKHSEILDMLAAEENFIRITREAQSRDLGLVAQQLENESGEFQGQVRDRMAERMKAVERAYGETEQSLDLSNRVHVLEQQFKDLKGQTNSAAK